MGPCIEWTGAKDTWGYGIKKVNGKIQKTHRLAWIEHNGSIPKGMYICHRCDNPGCMNQDHLFLGTPKDNALDRNGKKRGFQQNKTHCPYGHEYSPSNTSIRILTGRGTFGRRCKTCHREREAARRSHRATT